MQGERGPELVAGVVDEAPLALDRRLEPGEHRVQRLREPGELVVASPRGKPLGEVAGGDELGALTHLLDRPQGGGDRRVAGERGEEQGDRAADQEQREQVGQSLVAVVEGGADDGDLAVAERDREDPEGSLEAGQLRDLDEDRSVGRLAEHVPAEEGVVAVDRKDRSAAELCGALDDLAVRVQDLREVLVVLEQPGGLALEVTQAVGPRLQARVDRLGQPVLQSQVEEDPEAREQQGHRQGERQGHTDPDREPPHPPPSSRSLYPAPRTVSIELTPKGASTFLRRSRMNESTTLERFSYS